MKKASQLFTEKQIKSIENQIAEIEQKTVAEIVPVISTKSSNYNEVDGAFCFGFSLIMLSLFWFLVQLNPESNVMWEEGWVLSFNLLSTLSILLISYFVANKVLISLFGLKRVLIDTKRMKNAVQINAQTAFQRFRVKNTEGSTGLIIYISLFEQMVHIIGDEMINKKISPQQWQSICKSITKGFENEQPLNGITDSLDQIALLITENFPAKDNNPNQLANKINFID